MTTMLENRMVIGDYYDDPEPDWTCPRCHTDWFHHHDLWESYDATSRREPQHSRGCILCMCARRTPKDAIAYARQYEGVALDGLVKRMLEDYNITGDFHGDPHPMLELFIAADPDLVEQRAEEWAEEQDDDYYDWYLDNH